MFIRLLLLFTIVPLVELSILMKLGAIFGVLHTIGIVIITGIIGAYLARDQGLKVIRQLQENLSTGQLPTNPIIEGILVLISAALLVTPGVLTDIIGFILVIPNTRKIVRDFLKEYFKDKIVREGKRFERHKDDDDVIDI